MATPKSQRIGIWIIAIVMLVGTIGSFVVMILANENSSVDRARVDKLMNDYKKESDAYQAKVSAQEAELSRQYFAEFNTYAGRPAPFDPADIKGVTSIDLKEGTGERLGKDATFTAYYIGWTPDGKVFDGSINGERLKSPFNATPGGTITGWIKGVEGMKIGGVRELSISSEEAYGEAGSGASIPPNTPLKFIIMIIPAPEVIAQPEMPKELLDYYSR